MPLNRPTRLFLKLLQLHASSLIADPLVDAAVGPASQYHVNVSTYAPNPGDIVTIFAQLTDAVGNAVATSGIVVTWSRTGTGTFGSPTSTTDASGLATVTFTVSSTPGTVQTVTATDGSARTGISGEINVSGGTTPAAFFSENYFSTADFAGAYFS